MVGGHRRGPRHRGRTGRPFRRARPPTRVVRPVRAGGASGAEAVVAGCRRGRRRGRGGVRRVGGGPVRSHRPVGQQRRGARAHRPPGRRRPRRTRAARGHQCRGRAARDGRLRPARAQPSRRRITGQPVVGRGHHAVPGLGRLLRVEGRGGDADPRWSGWRRPTPDCWPMRWRPVWSTPTCRPSSGPLPRTGSPRWPSSTGSTTRRAFAPPSWVAACILERCLDPDTRWLPEPGHGSVQFRVPDPPGRR